MRSNLRVSLSKAALAVFAAGALFCAPAQAQDAPAPAYSQHMVYEVYAGGINAVSGELAVEYGPDKRYHMLLAAYTKGFLTKIVPWKGSFETWGWQLEEGLDRPELHRSVATWKGEDDLKEYHYGRDGSFKSLKVVEAGDDKTPDALADELVQNTTDALTATLAVMKAVATGGSCDSRAEVFDGARRFELVFSHQADDLLTSNKYNVYDGPAARCVVEVKPVAGKWHDKPRGWMSIQEQGRDKGALPTVWMAKIVEDGPAVPVKVRVKTDYGTLYMHMTGHVVK